MYTEKDGNYIGCWKLEGHKGWPIIPQPIVPNMSYFKVRSQLINGITSIRVALTCVTFFQHRVHVKRERQNDLVTTIFPPFFPFAVYPVAVT